MATDLRSLLRSTPVRLALGIALLTAVISLGTTGIAYLRIREELEEGLQASLDQTTASLSAARSTEALYTLVAAEAEVADPRIRIVVFHPSSGDPPLGNAAVDLTGAEPRFISLPYGRPLSYHGYQLRILSDDRGTLYLGESREPIDEMGEVIVGLIALSLVPTLILSLSFALAIASRSARRVGQIEDTLSRLTLGDLQARVGAATDSSDDLARIGRGLDQMAAAQEQSVAALKQVSADIAHDLKTPVQRLAVLMADLRRRVDDNSAEADIADRAVAEADRAVSVFQSLLQIAQIEGGSPKARFAPVDLAAIIATFADIFGPAAEDSGHPLIVDLPGNGPVTVLGDKALLGQVVANLIENALRHTPADTSIRLRLRGDASGTVLSVEDSGPGIPPDEQDKVLRRLYRLERSRTTPGNGLGLALVAAVAELHGARIDLADNSPGLIVRLRFPPHIAISA